MGPLPSSPRLLVPRSSPPSRGSEGVICGWKWRRTHRGPKLRAFFFFIPPVGCWLLLLWITRLLNKERNELGMMQVACNRPIILPSAVSKGNRTIKPWVVLSRGRTSVPVLAPCRLLCVNVNGKVTKKYAFHLLISPRRHRCCCYVSRLQLKIIQAGIITFQL